jgi:plasmid stabilization system protein ParE
LNRYCGIVSAAFGNLSRSPFIYRKSGASPFLREVLIPFGSSGYVALFEIEDATTVTILAVRHQLEDDYH